MFIPLGVLSWSKITPFKPPNDKISDNALDLIECPFALLLQIDHMTCLVAASQLHQYLKRIFKATASQWNDGDLTQILNVFDIYAAHSGTSASADPAKADTKPPSVSSRDVCTCTCDLESDDEMSSSSGSVDDGEGSVRDNIDDDSDWETISG